MKSTTHMQSMYIHPKIMKEKPEISFDEFMSLKYEDQVMVFYSIDVYIRPHLMDFFLPSNFANIEDKDSAARKTIAHKLMDKCSSSPLYGRPYRNNDKTTIVYKNNSDIMGVFRYVVEIKHNKPGKVFYVKTKSKHYIVYDKKTKRVRCSDVIKGTRTEPSLFILFIERFLKIPLKVLEYTTFMDIFNNVKNIPVHIIKGIGNGRIKTLLDISKSYARYSFRKKVDDVYGFHVALIGLDWGAVQQIDTFKWLSLQDYSDLCYKINSFFRDEKGLIIPTDYRINSLEDLNKLKLLNHVDSFSN